LSASEEFVQRQREGCYAVLEIFLLFPALGVGALLESVADIPQGPIPLIVILAFAVVVYFGLGVENRVVVDERSIRFSHASVRCRVPASTEATPFVRPTHGRTSIITKASVPPIDVWPCNVPPVFPATNRFPDGSTPTELTWSSPADPKWRVQRRVPSLL
jgi:hypothetical protein